MNTDKPGAPYYQRSVEETLASVQSSPEGISGTEAATPAAVWRKRPAAEAG